MVTKREFLLEQMERTQLQRTRRRRDQRSHRRRLLVLGAVAMCLLFVLGLPSFICHTPVARSLLARAAAAYAIDADAATVRIGWVTPLQVTGLALRGQRAGSEIAIDRLTAGVTILDWMASGIEDLGQVSLRGVQVQSEIWDDHLGLEDDFIEWFEPPSNESTMKGLIQLQDLSL